MNLADKLEGVRLPGICLTAIRFFGRRRLNFIVKSRMQFRLLTYAIAYITFFVFCLAAILFVPLILKLREADPMSQEAISTATGILYLHGKYWPAVLLPLGVIAVHSILTSFKIAGPLYRFNTVFRSMAKGRLPGPIRLRKGDYLKGEMEEINRMVSGLRERIEEIKAVHSDLDGVVSQLDREKGGELSAEHDRLLRELAARNADLKEKLSAFQPEP